MFLWVFLCLRCWCYCIFVNEIVFSEGDGGSFGVDLGLEDY